MTKRDQLGLFGDEAELALPEHDRIVQALDRWVRNAPCAASALCPDAKTKLWKELTNTVSFERKQVLISSDAPVDWALRGVWWEVPLREGERFTRVVGFADLLAQFSYTSDIYRGFGLRPGVEEVDADERSDERHRADRWVAFEVKPTIRSLGTLMRQLQYYKTLSWPSEINYWGGARPALVVVAPRRELPIALLQSQGFGWVAVEDLASELGV